MYVGGWQAKREHLTQLHDLKDLFTILKQHDVRIGVCTSDSRIGTLKSLADLDVLHLVDVAMCGDDPHGRPKPDPHNAYLMCTKMNVRPEEVIMVGDTPTDIMFGKNAKLGMSIGVLTGVGQREDLEQAWYGDSSVATEPAYPSSRAPSDAPAMHIVPCVADIISLLLPDRPVSVRTSTEMVTHTHGTEYRVPNATTHKLLIFDKDGSLTNIHPRWSKWAEDVCARLGVVTSREIGRKFLEILGYSPEKQRASGGMLAESSMLHIRDSMRYLLGLHGYTMTEAKAVEEQVWFIPELDRSDLLPGVVDTLLTLRKAGFLIALNTSDGRDACQAFLSYSDLKPHIDLVLAAEDAASHPKPSPHTVEHIMRTMNVEPQQTVVIGDTPADLMSGRAAGVGLTVGVLSGFSMAHNLLSHANVLIPNVTHLPSLFYPMIETDKKSSLNTQ